MRRQSVSRNGSSRSASSSCNHAIASSRDARSQTRVLDELLPHARQSEENVVGCDDCHDTIGDQLEALLALLRKDLDRPGFDALLGDRAVIHQQVSNSAAAGDFVAKPGIGIEQVPTGQQARAGPHHADSVCREADLDAHAGRVSYGPGERSDVERRDSFWRLPFSAAAPLVVGSPRRRALSRAVARRYWPSGLERHQSEQRCSKSRSATKSRGA